MVNAVAIGAGANIALARHHDNRVLENSHINVQTETGQSQDCETASGTSPISDSCTASSSDTITQGAPPSSSSSCPTIHPTVLTLNLFPPIVPLGGIVFLSGTLIDTCTTAGVNGGTIIFTFTGIPRSTPHPGVTDATGRYFGVNLIAPFIPGTYTVQAHFAGIAGKFGPSNSQTQIYTVV